jgi:hypothetical protein
MSKGSLTAQQALRLGALLEYERSTLAAIGEKFGELNAEIEQSQGLKGGAIGTTHRYDIESGCVVEVPAQEEASTDS